MKSQPARQGRPRSKQARQAILAAALGILKEQGYRAVSIEGIAAHAGVGKQTIYRWWKSKAEIVLEAFAQEAEALIPVPDTGSAREDLCLFLERTFRALKKTGPIVCALMAEAQISPTFGPTFREQFIEIRRKSLRSILQNGKERGELAEQVDVEFLIDCLYGPMWYRLLSQHAPLDKAFAAQLARSIVPDVSQRLDVSV